MNKKIVLALQSIFIAIGLCAEVPHDGRYERAAFVASLINPGDIGAEIGVNEGIFAYHVLLPCQPHKLYLIDPWQYGLQADMETDLTPEKQWHRDQAYERVRQLFAPYDNVEVVRMKSEDAVSSFPDSYFDYVYIDGEHSYAAVQRDLANYFPKVKVGGLLIGDDYGWTGIKEAVQDFLAEHSDEVHWFDDPYSGRTAGQFVIRKLK